MNPIVFDKLKTLADAAKYDVSCASSGTTRGNQEKGIGSTSGWGICHSFTEDGRCVSLLKIMLTNHCIFDCGYCMNRRSNDIPRSTFTVSELVELTLEFYRRNYIEGLFLSSGIVRNADYTMERMVRVAKDLRLAHRYNGYIHLKSIPGASRELIGEAGLYADRLSCNIEMPSEESLKLIAPDKNYQSVFRPMHYIQQGFLQGAEEKKKYRNAPRFAPAGQSTQMIIGASPDNDKKILSLADALYQRPAMKRVYYSGYIPINTYDTRLPALTTPPLVRENRL
jgi:putative DNA modification/repair radical SAM protein